MGDTGGLNLVERKAEAHGVRIESGGAGSLSETAGLDLAAGKRQRGRGQGGRIESGRAGEHGVRITHASRVRHGV